MKLSVLYQEMVINQRHIYLQGLLWPGYSDGAEAEHGSAADDLLRPTSASKNQGLSIDLTWEHKNIETQVFEKELMLGENAWVKAH